MPTFEIVGTGVPMLKGPGMPTVMTCTAELTSALVPMLKASECHLRQLACRTELLVRSAIQRLRNANW